MLEVYNMSWQGNENTAVALGYFDGVHIAHQTLISRMGRYAEENGLKKAVFTFTKSITLGHKGKDLLTQAQKLECMQSQGIDLYYSPDFSEFSGLEPEEFVQKILVQSMKAKAVFCGENFFFGIQVKFINNGIFGYFIFCIGRADETAQQSLIYGFGSDICGSGLDDCRILLNICRKSRNTSGKKHEHRNKNHEHGKILFEHGKTSFLFYNISV